MANNKVYPGFPPFDPALLGGAPGPDSADPGDYLQYSGPSEAPPEAPQPKSGGPGVGSFLKEILKQFALQAPQSVGDAAYAHLAPEAFKQSQETKRQKAQLAQQLNLHNTMTPYERMQMDRQKTADERARQEHADVMAQHQFENQMQMRAAMANGTLRELQTPGTVNQGGIGQVQQGGLPPELMQLLQGGGGQAPQQGSGPQAPQGGGMPTGDELMQVLQGLPSKGVAPQQLTQAPPLPANAIQAGGMAGVPVQDATMKDMIDVDTSHWSQDSPMGKALKAAGIKGVVKLPALEVIKMMQTSADKEEALSDKKATQQAALQQIEAQAKIGHEQIDQRFSDDYYKNLHHGHIDPMRDFQRKAMHAALDAAVVSGRKAFNPTDVVRELDKIVTTETPWEKQQNLEYGRETARVAAATAAGIAHQATKDGQAATLEQRGYDKGIDELRAHEKPLYDQAQRLGRLDEALSNKTAAIDPLIAPEFISVMAGGAGSGIRITDTDIKMVLGGRNKWEEWKGAIEHAIGSGRQITDQQRKEMLAFVDIIKKKNQAKFAVIGEARKRLVAPGQTSQDHRATLEDFDTKLRALESPGISAPAGAEPDFIVVNGRTIRNPKKK